MSLLLSLTRQLGATLSNPASPTSPIRPKICRLSKTRCQSTNFRITRYYAAVAASAKPASTEQNMIPTSPGAGNVMIILEDVRRLLASDFGGNIKWVQRIDSAKVDLQQTRKGRIAGGCNSPVVTDAKSWEMVRPVLKNWSQHCCKIPWPIARSLGKHYLTDIWIVIRTF